MTGTERFRPNPAQEAAVAHGSGPLRILAGAGSGKTTTLVRRILRLIESGACTPGQLLMLTFTTKATADMRRKVAEALPPGSEQPRIETYHAYALALVREFAPELGLPPEPVLLTPGPVKLFTRRHIHRLGISRLDLARLDTAVSTALDFFRWHRHEATYLADEAALLAKVPEEEADLVRELLEAHRRYRALLAEQGALDYDDLIALAVQLLEERPEVRRQVQERHPVLLVDEYQDTDHLQGRYIQLLAGDGANLTIVGDPDQTIYTWRGAAVSNILRFEEAYEGVRTIPMVINYRSTPAILAAANAVIARNQRGKQEPLEADREQGDLPIPQGRRFPDWESEARWLAQEVRRLHEQGVAWKEIAVLVRLNRHKLPLYSALLEAGVPVVVVGGMDLFEDPETARFITYLEALASPDDDGALSVALSLPRYGLTDHEIARLARQRQHGDRLIDAVARQAAGDAALTRFLEEFWPLFRLQHAEGCEAAIRAALRLHASSLGLQARLNADQLLPLAEFFFAQAALLVDPASTTPPLAQFCAYLRELQELGDTPEGVPLSDEEDGVRLMTVHAAKGLEFP
ncbi:MAG: ATP-dependent helicase, partial [Bacillota bacterium]